MLKLIACVDKNNGIGKNNNIPWKNSEEMLFFKNTTINHIVVMGYHTFKSLNKPLKDRINIVMSHNKELELKNIIVTSNIDFILNLAKFNDVYIIGGSQIYQLFNNYYNELIISYLNDNYNCDTFLKIDLDNYKLVKETNYSTFINKIYIKK